MKNCGSINSAQNPHVSENWLKNQTFRLKKKKLQRQKCKHVWEAQNALPKRILNKDEYFQENAWASFWTFEEECVERWRVDSEGIFLIRIETRSSLKWESCVGSRQRCDCHKIIFYWHLFLWSITCQQLQKIFKILTFILLYFGIGASRKGHITYVQFFQFLENIFSKIDGLWYILTGLLIYGFC